MQKVRIFQSFNEVGHAAAEFLEKHLKEAFQQKGPINLILVIGALQFSFFEALKKYQLNGTELSSSNWTNILDFLLLLNLPYASLNDCI